MHLPQTLQTDQLPILALPCDQVFMPAALDHLALIKHINYIRALNRTESVRDGNCGPPLCGGVQGGLHHGFGFAVERGGGFIKKED